MNYLLAIKAFEQWTEINYLSANAQMIWYKLMALANRCGWPEWISIDNIRLMGIAQIANEKSLIEAKKELEKAGFIQYQKGKKNCPCKYKLTENYDCIISDSQNAVNTQSKRSENDSQNAVNTTAKTQYIRQLKCSKNDSQNAVKTTAINKLKLKLNKNNKDMSMAAEAAEPNPKKRNIFVVPSLDDVTAYCLERGNKVDPEKFIDFYASKGWYVGKNKMKDWQAAVRTWEKEERKNIPLPNRGQASKSDITQGDYDLLMKKTLAAEVGE